MCDVIGVMTDRSVAQPPLPWWFRSEVLVLKFPGLERIRLRGTGLCLFILFVLKGDSVGEGQFTNSVLMTSIINSGRKTGGARRSQRVFPEPRTQSDVRRQTVSRPFLLLFNLFRRVQIVTSQHSSSLVFSFWKWSACWVCMGSGVRTPA